MLLMHAEDQLMAAVFKAFAQQQIVIFKKFQDIENRRRRNEKVYLFCDNGMSTSMMAQRIGPWLTAQLAN